MAEPTMRGWWQDQAGKWHPPEDRRSTSAPLPAARPVAPAKERRRLRPFTWAILVVNVLFLLWIVFGINDAANNCNGLAGSELDACRAGTAVGGTIAAGFIIFLWMAADVILGVIWLVTNRRS